MLKQPLLSRLLKPQTKPPIRSQDTEASSAQPTSVGSSRFSVGTLTKVAAAVSLLAVASGFAAVRLAPTRLQAALMPRRAAAPAPVSLPGDPTAESIVGTGDLFLTHQIFYRKLEALTGVPVSPLSTTPVPVAGSPAADALKPAGVSADNAGEQAIAGKTNNNGLSDAAVTKAEPAAPQPERVVAAAPPAPAIAPVDFSGTTIDSVLEMRVAVAKDVSAIGFATSGSGVIADLDGNALKSLTAETAALAEIANGIVVDGEAMPSAFWIYPEDGGYVAIGDSWYRGRVLIALRERGLIAVNYVLLGDYLYSVVGTEMSPSWALESLKAQAVAARSYALTHNIHPASEAYFDLDNTQRFQAYKGIDREANTTQLAVKATAGEFISHEGGIVESLYAASQAIVDDAHKGAGMSQLGAKDLAEQGYSYQEILAHYYPGTALGRIETDPE